MFCKLIEGTLSRAALECLNVNNVVQRGYAPSTAGIGFFTNDTVQHYICMHLQSAGGSLALDSLIPPHNLLAIALHENPSPAPEDKGCTKHYASPGV